jgi:hypothetical protein
VRCGEARRRGPRAGRRDNIIITDQAPLRARAIVPFDSLTALCSDQRPADHARENEPTSARLESTTNYPITSRWLGTLSNSRALARASFRPVRAQCFGCP